MGILRVINIFALLPLLLATNLTSAQTSVAPVATPAMAHADSANNVFHKGSIIGTISVGFIDYYRNNITMPAGFQKNNTSGFAPIYGRLEYGLSNTISLGALMSYDIFYDNFYQHFPVNGKIFERHNTDRVLVFSSGLSGYYHLGRILHSKKLDPFIGIGLTLNTIHHTAWPEGDSTATTANYTVSPSIKIGARYYITRKGSIFVDAGYDRQSVFSIGYSCRFGK